MTEEEWDRVVDVNLKGMYLCARAAVPGMAERGWGRVINMASRAAFTGSSAADVPYAASKAGVLGFTRAVARHLASKGITVNAIAPGSIDTELPTRGGRRTLEEWRAQVARGVPMGRIGAPEEVAEVVAFLASDGASYVTGETILITGGSHLQ